MKKILLLSFIFITTLLPLGTLAAFENLNEPILFTPQISIPEPGQKETNWLFSAGKGYALEPTLAPIAIYINSLYQYMAGAIGIIAAIMIMVGGIIWLTSAGSSTKVEEAKEMIVSSLIGMALVLCSWIILYTVNPDLVNLKAPAVPSIAGKTFCCDPATGPQDAVPGKDAQKNTIYSCPKEYSSGKICGVGMTCTVATGDDNGNTFGCIAATAEASAGQKCCEIWSEDSIVCTTRQASDTCGTGNANLSVTETPGACPKLSLSSGLPKGSCTKFMNSCAGKTEGTGCNDGFDGHCYNGVCNLGDGKEGQNCGTDGGKCVSKRACDESDANWLNGNNCSDDGSLTCCTAKKVKLGNSCGNEGGKCMTYVGNYNCPDGYNKDADFWDVGSDCDDTTKCCKAN